MAAAAIASVYTCPPPLTKITRISGAGAAAAVPEVNPVCFYRGMTCTRRLPYSANCRTSVQGVLLARHRAAATSWAADIKVRLSPIPRLKSDEEENGHLIVPLLRSELSRGCRPGFGSINGERYGAAAARLRTTTATTAAAAAVGSGFGASPRRWAEEAVENSGLKRVLIEILSILESQRRSREKWIFRLVAAIVASTAAGFLVSSFALRGGGAGAGGRGGGSFVMTSFVILGMAAACLLGRLAPYSGSGIQGTWERLQSRYAQAGKHFQSLDRGILHIVAPASHKIGSVLSSRSRWALEDSERNSSGAESARLTVEAARGGRRNSRDEDDVILGNQLDTETVIARISQSVGHVRGIIAAMELAAARPDSVIGVESGIRDLHRELNLLETTVLEKKQGQAQGQRHSELICDGPSVGTSSADLNAGRKCGDGLERTEGWTAGSNSVERGISDHSENEIDDPPKLSGDATTFKDAATFESEAQASDGGGAMVATDSLPPEAWTRPLWEEDPEALTSSENSNSYSIIEGDNDDHEIEIQNLSSSSVSNFDGVEGLMNHPGERKGQKVEMVERGASPSLLEFDPWQEGTSTVQPSTAQEFSTVSAGEEDEIGNPRLGWRNGGQGGQLLDIVLVVDGGEQTKKGEVPSIVEGVAKGKGGSSYGSVDFWGKKAGSSSRTSRTGEQQQQQQQQQQRGVLTRSKATGRGGSGSGSVDDWGEEENWQQRQDLAWRRRNRRMASEDESEEQPAQFVRNEQRGTSSSSRAGQPWNDEEPEISDRVERRYESRLGRDEDDGGSAGATADEYGLSKSSSSSTGDPQTLRGDGNPSMRKAWHMEDERVSRVRGISEEKAVNLNPRGPTGGRYGPPDSRTGSPPSRSLEGERRDTDAQAIGDARYVEREGRGVNNGEFGGSSEGRSSEDVLSNPEGREYESSEFRSSSSSAYGGGGAAASPQSGTKSETSERSLALERSKQARTLQIERCLDQAEALLEEGMQGLEGRIEVGVAEGMLYDAARLFESASEMAPTDLTAVGQWGNTLLVHGELKLKVSQQIRSMLTSVPKYPPNPNFPFSRGAGRAKEEEEREREAMELTLQEVCEECEELLVDAGRKYRWALGLDRSDVRALYNWGLALCHRGQLIAEEGGEKAIQDADKVYLAASDKFEAMLGASQDYAAGGTAALLNWGLALRDRSRLRDMGDKERVRLLLQARERFQEAVRVDPSYVQARGAVAACSTELKELRNYESLQIQQQQQDVNEKPSRGWWQRGD